MKPETTWQSQKAKAQFSALIRAAQAYPQTITVHGKAKVMVVPCAMFLSMLKEIRELRKRVEEPKNSQTGQSDITLRRL